MKKKIKDQYTYRNSLFTVFIYFSVPIDTGGSLTEAEKMLLLMCQSQSFPAKDETDISSKVATEINTTSSSPKKDVMQEEGTTKRNRPYCSYAISCNFIVLISIQNQVFHD